MIRVSFANRYKDLFYELIRKMVIAGRKERNLFVKCKRQADSVDGLSGYALIRS